MRKSFILSLDGSHLVAATECNHQHSCHIAERSQLWTSWWKQQEFSQNTELLLLHRPFAAESGGANFTASGLVEGSMSVLENETDRKKPSSADIFSY